MGLLRTRSACTRTHLIDVTENGVGAPCLHHFNGQGERVDVLLNGFHIPQQRCAPPESVTRRPTCQRARSYAPSCSCLNSKLSDVSTVRSKCFHFPNRRFASVIMPCTSLRIGVSRRGMALVLACARTRAQFQRTRASHNTGLLRNSYRKAGACARGSAVPWTANLQRALLSPGTASRPFVFTCGCAHSMPSPHSGPGRATGRRWPRKRREPRRRQSCSSLGRSSHRLSGAGSKSR